MNTKNNNTTILEQAELLYHQAINARNYLDILENISKLSRKYNKEICLAYKFFVEVSRALDKALVLELAKMYEDKDKSSINIEGLFNLCLKRTKNFNCLYVDPKKRENESSLCKSHGNLKAYIPSGKTKVYQNYDYLKRFQDLKGIENNIKYAIEFPNENECHEFRQTLNFYFPNNEITINESNNSSCIFFYKSTSDIIPENLVKIDVLCRPEMKLEAFGLCYCNFIYPKTYDLRLQRDKIYAHNDREALDQSLDNIQSMSDQYSLQNKENIDSLIKFAIKFTAYIILNLKGENHYETENRHPDISDLEILLETVSQNAKLLPEL